MWWYSTFKMLKTGWSLVVAAQVLHSHLLEFSPPPYFTALFLCLIFFTKKKSHLLASKPFRDNNGVLATWPEASEGSEQTKHWRGKPLFTNNRLPLQCLVSSEASDASEHDYMLKWTASEPLILCLSCNKWSCGAYQTSWKEWNALIWQICYKESTCCQSTDTERHMWDSVKLYNKCWVANTKVMIMF